jgi:hypothetical protein|nr:MAG TPA: hypothetical protein [Caudoviricetes sp.]
MEINDIFKLIDAGFTKEDIIELSKPVETVADVSQVETVADVSQVETKTITPEETAAGSNIDYIKALQKSIDDLKKTIIATNQLRDLGGEKHTSVDDINDYIINGRNKK